MNTILTVGDTHISNNQDLSRFDALGKYIVDKRPTHIVLIGDFLTLECLSAWDMNKRMTMEGKRYNLEIDAGNLALDKMLQPMLQYNKNRKKNKKSQYKPLIIYLEGNHEDRLTRYLQKDPTFAGFANIQQDLKLTKRGIKWVPYREYYDIGGIGFTHIPHNKVKPIMASGVSSVAKRATQCTVKSVVFGHTHELEVANQHLEGMPHLQQVLNCGCFFTEHEEYVHGRVTNYWKGVVLLQNYKHGRFDIETTSMNRLFEEYGDG